MKHIVDLESWERRGNYAFFRDHLNAWYSVTTELDCTESYEQSKQTGRSFFLRYLYAALRAANEVPAFRYRMDAQGTDRLVRYGGYYYADCPTLGQLLYGTYPLSG